MLSDTVTQYKRLSLLPFYPEDSAITRLGLNPHMFSVLPVRDDKQPRLSHTVLPTALETAELLLNYPKFPRVRGEFRSMLRMHERMALSTETSNPGLARMMRLHARVDHELEMKASAGSFDAAEAQPNSDADMFPDHDFNDLLYQHAAAESLNVASTSASFFPERIRGHQAQHASSSTPSTHVWAGEDSKLETTLAPLVSKEETDILAQQHDLWEWEDREMEALLAMEGSHLAEPDPQTTIALDHLQPTLQHCDHHSPSPVYGAFGGGSSILPRFLLQPLLRQPTSQAPELPQLYLLLPLLLQPPLLHPPLPHRPPLQPPHLQPRRHTTSVRAARSLACFEQRPIRVHGETRSKLRPQLLSQTGQFQFTPSTE